MTAVTSFLLQLNFIGVTVERDRRYIHFNSDQFMFAPVPIGQKNGPVQVYELFNGGAMPVKFSFGLVQLELLNQVRNTMVKELHMLFLRVMKFVNFVNSVIFDISQKLLVQVGPNLQCIIQGHV